MDSFTNVPYQRGGWGADGPHSLGVLLTGDTVHRSIVAATPGWELGNDVTRMICLSVFGTLNV